MTEDTLIRIVGPQGTDEVNDSGKRYPISPDGGFYVPAEALGPLLKTGGFIVQPRTQSEIVTDIARLVATLKPGRIRDLFSAALIDIFPDAPDRAPPSPATDDQPAANATRTAFAAPLASSVPKLVIPNPAAVPLGRVSGDG